MDEYHSLEGRYSFSNPERRREYVLYLKHGSFSLIRTTRHETGSGGISETISGDYSCSPERLTLTAKTRAQESWLSDEEAEGEAMVEPWDAGPIPALICGEVISCRAFGIELNLKQQ